MHARVTVSVFVSLLVAVPGVLWAEEQPAAIETLRPDAEAATSIRASISRHMTQSSAVSSRRNVPFNQTQQQSAAPKKSFITRHPVISGMLIGMAAGSAVAAGAWHSEAAFVGFYTGAAGGALLGWAVSR
jgi:hypothetical protein